jgi:hypothetical protein
VTPVDPQIEQERPLPALQRAFEQAAAVAFRTEREAAWAERRYNDARRAQTLGCPVPGESTLATGARRKLSTMKLEVKLGVAAQAARRAREVADRALADLMEAERRG